MNNVCLIVLDTVRLDYFEKYATKTQERADVKTDAWAASSWSVPSHASMFTGVLPHEHGSHTYNRTLGDLDTFLDGIDGRCVGVSSNIYASPSFGFDTHFDDFVSVSRSQRFPEGVDVQEVISGSEPGLERYLELLRSGICSDSLVKSILNGILLKTDDLTQGLPVTNPMDSGTKQIVSRVDRELDESAFVFANIMEAHTPLSNIRHFDSDVDPSWSTSQYNPNEFMRKDELNETEREFVENHEQLYISAIEYIDDHLADLIDSNPDTTFVITSDHGENMFSEADRGLWCHSASVTTSLLNVPLVLANAPEATVDSGLVSLLDIPVMIESAMDGDPVVPTRETVPAEVLGPGLGELECDTIPQSEWESAKRCVVQDDTKIVWDSEGNIEEVLISDDSVRSPIEEIPQWAQDEFSIPIDEAKERAPSADRQEVDEATQQRLEDLGYA